MFSLVDKAEDFSLEDSLSDRSERLLPRGEGGARIYRGFCKIVRKSKITVTERKPDILS